MTTPSTHSPEAAQPPEPCGEDDGYSPAFAAVALLVTIVLLAAPVVALRVLEAL